MPDFVQEQSLLDELRETGKLTSVIKQFFNLSKKNKEANSLFSHNELIDRISMIIQSKDFLDVNYNKEAAASFIENPDDPK